MKYIFTVISLLFFTFLHAQDANLVWAKQLGAGSDNYTIYFTAVDAAGNTYTTGFFQGSLDFNPDPAITNNLTAAGGDDIFISKLDAAGNFVWAKKLGGTSNENGYSITVDGSGNVYTIGSFQGTADFNPDPAVTNNLTSGGGYDIFISKLDAAGNFVWAKQLGGVSLDEGQSIAVDASGNVYATGAFQGTADFNPDPAVTNNLTSAGSADIFISKLNASGNFVWVKQLGGTSYDYGESIAVDASGNVYATGAFQGTADFNPDPATTNNLTSAGNDDIFISKLDASGNFVWAKQLGGTSGDYSYSIAVDGSGVYTAGHFSGTADFNPDPAVTNNFTSAGFSDVFISKLDAAGNFVWAKQLGGTQTDHGYSMVIDVIGNVYVTGEFRGTADFNPNPAVTDNLISAGDYDIFVSKLDAAGNFVWAKKLGGTSIDFGNSIGVDASGNVYTSGQFYGTSDFNPDPAIISNLISLGTDDIFISKLDGSGNFVLAKQIGSGVSSDYGRSVTVDASGNVYTTGYFRGTADFNPDPAATYSLTSAGLLDIFVSKLDASGNFVWAKRFGGIQDDHGTSIAVDALGNVYTTGDFKVTADFDPDPAITNNLISDGFEDGFICKLDAAGNFVWAKKLGGASDDYGTSITVDASGNVYTTGYFGGTIDFNPDPAVTNNLTPAGSYDIFISKLDASGNYVWARSMGGTSFDVSYFISVDASGVYTTGQFFATADFNPDPATTYNLTSAGSGDIFISKLDASGNFVWAKNMGGASNDVSLSITADASGVYTTGNFNGTADFNPDPAVSNNLTSAGSDDIFISKLDASGNFVWAKKMGGTSRDISYSIKTDASGNVYTTGYFAGVADFDPDPAVTNNLTSAGNNDIFISKLDASGNFVWAKQLGSTLADAGYSLAVNASGNIHAAGDFLGTVDFNPDPAITNNLTATGNSEIFAIKLSQAAILPVTLSGFTIQTDHCTATLNWTTASEQNSKHFEVQHSTDGRTFTTTGLVPASGNSNTEKHYSYNSKLIQNINYFRLRMLDVDGRSKFSAVVTVTGNCSNNVILLYPNPAKSKITISELSGVNELRLLDDLGKIVRTIKTTNVSETINLHNLPAGNYIVQVVQNNKVIDNIKLIKE